MKVEIMYTTSSTPKVLENVDAVYVRGFTYHFQLSDGTVLSQPMLHIWQVSYPHGSHVGTTRKDKSDG